MQRSTFKVLFYVKRQSEKHGQVPVMGRITINGTMSQFSCKLSVRTSLWKAKANKASGRSLESQRVNEKLENIKTNIGKPTSLRPGFVCLGRKSPQRFSRYGR